MRNIWTTAERLSERYLPSKIHRVLFVHKYVHFFLTGVTGVLLNLLVTWGLTTYFFGIERYFEAFIYGIAVNLLFNFTLHTIVTFQTTSRHISRFMGFIAYSLIMSSFQAWIVKVITPVVGLEYYLLVIALTILSFSVVSFLLFKFFLFKQSELNVKKDENRGPSPLNLDGAAGKHTSDQVPLLLAIVMAISFLIHVAGLFYVIENKGYGVLTAGDATVYMDLASDIREGRGFSYGANADSPEMYRTPALPLLLAPFTGFENGLLLYLLLSTGLMASVLIPLLVYLIGKDVFGRKVGLIGGILMAFEPQLAFSSWSPLTDTPFLLVELFVVWAYLRARSSDMSLTKKIALLTFAGLCAGYGILLRPGNMMLFVIFVGGIALWDALKGKRLTILLASTLLFTMFLTTVPWQMRNHALTGQYQITPSIWGFLNVNYLSAVTTIETGAIFSTERRKQKVLETQLLGREEYSQTYNDEEVAILRTHVLTELWAHRDTVLKLEAMLIFSYFTNDNYYNQLIRNGFVEPVKDRISPTQVFLREGLSGIPRILEDMRKQYYVPIVSRLYQIGLLILAGIALWRLPRPLAVLLLLIMAFSAFTTSTTSLGVEIRYRMPIMPILFLLAGYTIATGFPWKRKQTP